MEMKLTPLKKLGGVIFLKFAIINHDKPLIIVLYRGDKKNTQF